jgi:hypothetical protein
MVREIHMKAGFEKTWELAEKAGPAVRETWDNQEGIRSFLEKRQPQFRGY